MKTDEGKGLSKTSLSVAGLLFGAGVLCGVPFYLAAGEETVTHVPGTEATPVFVGLSVLALLSLLLAVRHSGWGLLMAPYGQRAATRLRRTLKEGGPARRGLVLLLLLVNGYDLLRSGFQVIAGLDPDFLENAWGGPSYLGAMYAHYLVAALIWAVSALLLHRLLFSAPLAGTTPHRQGASGPARG
jgi:hypothetical protein